METKSVVVGIYEAATDPSRWPVAIQAISDAIGARTWATFPTHALVPCVLPSVMHPEALAPMAIHAEHFSTPQRNPMLGAMVRHRMPAGSASTLEMLVDRSTWHRTEFYNVINKPHDIGDACLLALARHEDGGHGIGTQYSMLVLTRPDGRRGFGIRERRIMSELFPHLRMAATLHARLNGERDQVQVGLQALDALPIGVFLAGGDGRIRHANRAAERLLRQGDGLALRLGRFEGMDPARTAALTACVARTAGTFTGQHPHPGETLFLPRPSGKSPFAVTVAPLPWVHPYPVAAHSVAVIVMVVDPDAAAPAAPEVLRAMFDLTPAEARVALALADGATPQEIADQANRRLKTVRAQVESIYSKLRVRRQAELVRLVVKALSALPAAPSPD